MNYIGVCKAEERGILCLHLDMGMGAGFACASHVVGKKNLSDTELAAKAAKMSYSISVVGHMKPPLFSYLKME